MPKKVKKLIVLKPEILHREFYSNYHPDHWLYRVNLLKNSHDKYSEVGPYICDGIVDVDEKDFKKMMRTELHFLYFQMIETLFEIIFALSKHDQRDLWIALSFSSDIETVYFSETYRKIKEFSEGILEEPNFEMKVKLNNGKEISLLRYLFFFSHEYESADDKNWEKAESNIHGLLKAFAKDFSDRDDYNSYKHSLRFYNSGFTLGISQNPSDTPMAIARADDAIVYLTEKNNEELPNDVKQVSSVTKGFDFQRDYKCCLLLFNLIHNIIETRKYSIVGPKDKPPIVFNFLDTSFRDLQSSAAISRFEMTV